MKYYNAAYVEQDRLRYGGLLASISCRQNMGSKMNNAGLEVAIELDVFSKGFSYIGVEHLLSK